jgi:hypothetical protein
MSLSPTIWRFREGVYRVDDGKLSVTAVANILDLARRQEFWLLKANRGDCAPVIRHKALGRPSNN